MTLEAVPEADAAGRGCRACESRSRRLRLRQQLKECDGMRLQSLRVQQQLKEFDGKRLQS